MSSQELERIKLDIHNNLSYEETDLLEAWICSIQTPEWTRRRKEKEKESFISIDKCSVDGDKTAKISYHFQDGNILVDSVEYSEAESEFERDQMLRDDCKEEEIEQEDE